MNYQQQGFEGQPLTTEQLVIIQTQQKSKGLAILFGLLLTGGGQMYVGKVGRGFAFLGAMVVSALLVLVIIGIPMMIGIFIWSLIDATNLVDEHNAMVYHRAQNPAAYAFAGPMATQPYGQQVYQPQAYSPPPVDPQTAFSPPSAPPAPPGLDQEIAPPAAADPVTGVESDNKDVN